MAETVVEPKATEDPVDITAEPTDGTAEPEPVNTAETDKPGMRCLSACR